MSMKKLERIQHDFENAEGPFSERDFPEKRLLEATDPDNEYEKAILLTAFATCDYNRDAMQLADNLVELYEWDTHHFDPKIFTSPHTNYNEAELADVLGEIGFRYPNRDAHALWENYEIIADEYGTIQTLLHTVEYDAPSLVERLRDDGFLCLKGDKIAPMYARFLSEYIHTLDRLWQLDIPVDTHIRRLSRDVFNEPDASDDEIRARWREVGASRDINPSVVDGALWLIGNNWDDWGESYWAEL